MKPASEVTSTETAEIVVHGAFMPRLTAWLETQDVILQPWPGPDEAGGSGYHAFILVPARPPMLDLTAEQECEYAAAWAEAEATIADATR